MCFSKRVFRFASFQLPCATSLRLTPSLRTSLATRTDTASPHLPLLLYFLAHHRCPPRTSLHSFATSYFELSSYLITLASSCIKVTAHRKAHIFLGTDHTCPKKISEKRCGANPHAGCGRSGYQGGLQPYGRMDLFPSHRLGFAPFQIPCATPLRLTPSLRTSYLVLNHPRFFLSQSHRPPRSSYFSWDGCGDRCGYFGQM